MTERKSLKPNEAVIFWLLAISSMMVIRVDVISLFFFLQVITIAAWALTSGKLAITGNKFINFIFIEMAVSTLLCMFSGVRLSYKKGAIATLVLLIPVYFVYAYIERRTVKKPDLLSLVRAGIKVTCLIELVWCLLQFLLYRLVGLDINQLIFVDLLHLTESASHFKDGVFMPSGLCWHAAFIAPVAVISYVFFDNWLIKGLALIDAVICNNSTALIVMGVCILLDFSFRGADLIKKKRVKKSIVLFVLLLVAVAIPLLLKLGVIQSIFEKVIYIFQRITGAVHDGGSAQAHMRYFTIYPEIVKNSSPIQVLFGYGPGCSGYPISMLTGQYASLNSWVVESDIMDILISRGMIGFVGFYAFLIAIAVKGFKLDRRYLILTICLILGGITYNIQFEWVILIELLLWLSISRKYNLFDDKHHDRKPIKEKFECILEILR